MNLNRKAVTDYLDLVLSNWATKGNHRWERRGDGDLPSTLEAAGAKITLVDCKRFGVSLVKGRNEERAGEAIADSLFDHPWDIIRIRLCGHSSEMHLGVSLEVQSRVVKRWQIIRACEYVGVDEAVPGTWFLILRGSQTKQGGRLSAIKGSQASYDVIVPFRSEVSKSPGRVLVDD